MLGDKKKAYPVILEKIVKTDIDKIAKSQERSASWLINNILKEWLKENKPPE